jgi:hypothetical protein
MIAMDATIISADARNKSTPEVPLGVTGGKTRSEYMFSALPQVADIVRSAFYDLAIPLVSRITAFWLQTIPGEL